MRVPSGGKDKLKIHSERFSVEVDKPGKIYAGSRFYLSAFNTQVTLDGVPRYECEDCASNEQQEAGKAP